jgi:hypothetical protein
MRNEYDFSHSRKNPYVKQLKRQITIRLDTMAVNYFNETAPRHSMANGRAETSSRPLSKRTN